MYHAPCTSIMVSLAISMCFTHAEVVGESISLPHPLSINDGCVIMTESTIYVAGNCCGVPNFVFFLWSSLVTKILSAHKNYMRVL